MKIKELSLILTVALLIGVSPTALAEGGAVDRATRVEEIKARWNPIFDQQYLELTALAAKARLDRQVLAHYNYLLEDFNHVRQVIDAALASQSGDIDAAAAYAEEETGEFLAAIPALANEVAKIKSIACIKGRTLKKITGLAPKCPSGYKKK
jgi:hypothetical protein